MRFILELKRNFPQLKERAGIAYDTYFGKTPMRPVEQRFPIRRDYEIMLVLADLAKENNQLWEAVSDFRKILKDINNEVRQSLKKQMYERFEQKLSEIEAAINNIKKQGLVNSSENV